MINTNKPTLHLALKKTWFEMILNGEKLVEYREIDEHYNELFAWGQIKINGIYYEADQINICFHVVDRQTPPNMLVACEGLSIGIGNPAWGAEPNVPYFRLDLGEILSVTND